jgi:two-component system, sensor histidine kinase and response regulator
MINMVSLLVIEDEDTIRENVKDILSGEGYEVLATNTGDDGIAIANERHPDLVLCDIAMPGMNGYEVLHRLRANKATNMIPFIFLTALSDRDNYRKAMELGGDDYLTKPFTATELLTSVKSRLGRSATMYAPPFGAGTENLAEVIPQELRTSLSNIIVFSELIAAPSNVTDDKLQAIARRSIRSAARSMEHQLENFFFNASLERLESGAEELEPLADTDVSAVIIESAGRQFQRAGRAFDLHTEIEQGQAFVPANTLLKIMRELLDSAIKHSQPGDPILVSGVHRDSSFELSITNCGIDMTADDSGSDSSSNGADRLLRESQIPGLGWVVAKRLAEMYGGELSFQTDLILGTTVTVTFAQKADVGGCHSFLEEQHDVSRQIGA